MLIDVVRLPQGKDGRRGVRDIGEVYPGKEGVAEGLERFPVGCLGGRIAGARAQLAHKLEGEVMERMR
jgi:hypothetical protein